MRMYRKKEESQDYIIYEYLCEDFQLPYTGIIEINKKTLETKLKNLLMENGLEKELEFML